VAGDQRAPDGRQGELAALTSPRLAALAERARVRGYSEAQFARSVADKSFAPAMLTLFDDLDDPTCPDMFDELGRPIR
jgi:hypothetical protein